MTDAEWADRDLATVGPTGRLDLKEARFPRLCVCDGLEEGGQMGGVIRPCPDSASVAGAVIWIVRTATRWGSESRRDPTKDRLPDNQIQNRPPEIKW